MGLKVFLVSAILTFSCGAHSTELKLGAGDVLRILVFEHADLTLETKVGPDGQIALPLIGQLNIAGQSPQAVGKKVEEMLEKGGFIRNAKVSILPTFLHSQQVSVLGQVNRPGRYPLDGTPEIADILALAGGISAEGGDVITVIRNGQGEKKRELVNLVESVRSPGTGPLVEIRPGDVIYVERAPRFYIYGEVKQPGMYRLEKDMTVLQALSIAGGLSQRGTEKGIRIKRRDAAGKMQVRDALSDEVIQTHDVVHVREALF